MSLTKKPTSHIFELDGVRALAVWLVLLDHAMYGWAWPPSTLEAIPLPIRLLGRYGWLGVDLFFILSGFLITSILLGTRHRSGYFYARRFLRIIPLYYLVICITWLLYGNRFNSYFLSSFVFLPNFYHLLGIAVPHGPGVFWSLAIEEHFYSFWPVLVRFLSHRFLIVMALLICILDPLARFYAYKHGVDPLNVIYPVTWFRLDGLAMGALLAIWSRSKYTSPTNDLRLAGGLLGLFVIETVALLPLGILKSGSVFRYNQAHLLFAALLLAVLGLRGTIWTAPLRSRFACLSGDLSYCTYLIHLSVGDGYQVLVRFMGWQPEIALGGFGALTACATFLIGVSFGLAMLSQRLIEGPAQRLKRYFEYVPAGDRGA
jgi:peptidoglycan/LPS O-acetylase OafA/YrhL